MKNLEKLKLLKEEVLGCNRCEISKNVRNKVFGHGNQEARVMLIGEAPGLNEDKKGIPFVGRAGKKLDQILESIGTDRESVYISNVVKCRPPKNRDPKTQEVKSCIEYLKKEIQLVGPAVIVAAGLVPFKSITDVPPKTSGRIIRQIQKETPFTYIYNKKIVVMYMYHPSYVMRSEGTDQEGPTFNAAKKDLLKAFELAGNLEKTNSESFELF